MKIAILMEGETEKVFLPCVRDFLKVKLEGRMPRLIATKYDGRIPKGEKLKRCVEVLLRGPDSDADHVIALTDVYTGSRDFLDAADAKAKMRDWVGPNDRFHPHAAQHDFEAWLLPFWADIQAVAKHNRKAPSGRPETVNHEHPPSLAYQRDFQNRPKPPRLHQDPRCAKNPAGQGSEHQRDGLPELRLFLNTILALCGGEAMHP